MHYWRKLERYHCCARLKCALWNPICRDLNTSQRLQYSIFNSKLPSSKYPRTLNQVGGVGHTEKYAVVPFCAFSSEAPLSLLKAESFVKSPRYRIKLSPKGGLILKSRKFFDMFKFFTNIIMVSVVELLEGRNRLISLMNG